MFFSGPIGIDGKRNTKNDCVWAKSIEDAGELLDCPHEKFNHNVMIWGGLHWNGLIPEHSPIFVHELKERARAAGVQLGAKGGLNAAGYAYMVTNEVLPEVRERFGGREVWQDDNARIHRAPAAIQACQAFAERIPVSIQAPKMADIWPVENLWGLLGERLRKRGAKTKEEMMEILVEEWNLINNDKELCRNLIRSIPKRLEACVRVGGRQIRRSDYEKPNNLNNNQDNINNLNNNPAAGVAGPGPGVAGVAAPDQAVAGPAPQ